MSLLLSFDEYQRARAKFVQAIADASMRSQNIDIMNNSGVIQLLKPLLADSVSYSNKNKSECMQNIIDIFYIFSCRYQVFNKLLHYHLDDLQIIMK